ncbi:MAG: Gfo/Idh/MocA family oxidoreductase [Candidatus Latescibacterota bacterium]|nr:Gfo/Idh/MocA family oxidoreductase [Candidatus Latescibacterota bacterium]
MNSSTTARNVAVIGCGGRGRAHAEGWQHDERSQLVACADPVEASRDEFCERFGDLRRYTDYGEMLKAESLDIVSVCTWTGMHREMIEAAAASGVQAIHSEKPMAPTWGDARAIHDACQQAGVVLTLCHQRRFGHTFLTARDLLRDGAIGDLRRIEATCPNLFDWGTHWFDICFFYNEESSVEWVMGQIEVAEDRKVFDVPLETSGLSWFRFTNGVEGLVTTGDASDDGLHIRLIGSEGIVELHLRDPESPLRLWRGSGWESPAFTQGVPDAEHTIASCSDLLACLDSGTEPELSSRKALAATELIFATYESSRRRCRIQLPLETDDSALLAMLADGSIGPSAS